MIDNLFGVIFSYAAFIPPGIEGTPRYGGAHFSNSSLSPQFVPVGGKSNGAALQPDPPRRDFLKLVIGAMSALVAAALAVPLIGTIIGPSFRKTGIEWTKVGDTSSLAVEEPINMKFPYKTEDAYIRETVTHSVWVVKHSTKDLTVFSPICVHLGCHFDWHPEIKEFICPCHGSVYSITGKVLGGPAPRPLDTLPGRLEESDLYVKYERFQAGIPEKIPV